MIKEKPTLPSYYLSFLLLFIAAFGFSQEKQFKILWEGTKVMSTESTTFEVPYFNKANFSFSDVNGLSFNAQWKTPNYIDEGSLQIKNVVYQRIAKSNLKDLDVTQLPKDLSPTLRNSHSRDLNYAFLKMSPIIYEGGQYKKVVSFDIQYKYGANPNYARNAQATTNSILNTGIWKKFYVEQSGVFKITKSFLDGLGINTNVDPRNIKIYSNGGRMLPLIVSGNENLDPVENPIKFIGEEDGVFNDNDYILFYAEGPYEFSQESNTHVNIFTEKVYYYVTTIGGLGKRMQPIQEPLGGSTISVETFDDYQFFEEDKENMGALGRRWFGESFQIENTQEVDFEFPNLITTEPLNVTVRFGSVTTATNTSMEVNINGNSFYETTFAAVADGIIGTTRNFSGQINASTETINVLFNYNNGGNPSSKAFLDYISIEGKRVLAYNQEQLRFINKSIANQAGVVSYRLANASSVREVWDVTNRFEVGFIENIESQENFGFKANAGQLRTYLAFNDSDVFTPSIDSNSNVVNQDLKGSIFLDDQGQFQDVDYIIITRSDMLSQAHRLAQINRERYNLNVKVVDLKTIYNEFNTANVDIAAIRNFVKYVYDNASAPENRLKYLCLFGDGSYDYKDRITNNTNVVPAWYSVQSTSLSGSFVSDDFYGMMDIGEGGMSTFNKLDIATGRILADTPQRARELVDKIEDYYAREALGDWRNNFIAVSDDVDVSWESTLQNTTDDIANLISTNKPYFNPIKIHSDAFQQEASSAGERYPTVNELFKDKIDVGALVINYFGHGGEDGLAKERIFDKNNAQDIRNVCKLHCFITITCEFTKFDNPNRLTAGEFTYWNKEAGAIALVTTTRQIFVTTGEDINIAFANYLFALDGSEYTSVAEALRLTKVDPQITTDQRNLVFFIGDPAMKLAFPKPGIRLTKINDIPVEESTEVLQALSYAKVSGSVVDVSGNVLNNFNGELSITIHDKFIQRQTLANNNICIGGGTNCPPEDKIRLDFETLGEALFRGQATVENGQFEVDFFVPRDINIAEGTGKVSFYAKSNTEDLDYTGANLDIVIGGVNENAEEDTIGPTITLFMNDESFVSGGITNEQPTLIAKLNDEHGINTASGIGHDIVAIIDGQETSPFVLNDYYKAEVDDYKNGTVSFQFRDLEPGLHTLSFKAWDVYNNSATTEVQFVVRDKDEILVIDNVLNYPNPFVDYTEFWFKHNSSDVLDISVQIFTVSGKLVRTLNGQTAAGSKDPSALSRDIVWDGRDDFGSKIGKGVYIYKLKVRSSLLNKQVEKIQKLVIL